MSADKWMPREERDRIREINATKTWGHVDSATEHTSKLLNHAEAADARIAQLCSELADAENAFEITNKLVAERDAEIKRLREALEQVQVASRGVPDQLGSDLNGDCSLVGCHCSNHIARVALQPGGGR